MKIYRLENESGEGPFVDRKGYVKTDPNIKFEPGYLYAFKSLSRFSEPSYKPFLSSNEFDLYEIEIEKAERISPLGEVLFDPEKILSKKKVW